MAKKSGDSFEDYAKKVQGVKLDINSRHNMPTPDHEESIAELVAEGERLLAEEEKLKSKQKTAAPAKDESKDLTNKLGSMSTNPYVRARVEVLNKMPKWKRSEIEEMEKTGNINNQYYDQFCKDVRILGDTFSSQN